MLIFNGYVTKKAYSKIKPFIINLVTDIMSKIDSYKVDTLLYDLPFPYRGKGEQVYNALLVCYFPYQATLPGERFDDFIEFDYCKVKGRVKFKPQKMAELYKLNKDIDNELNNIVNFLNLVNKSQMLQAKEIHDYVCNKMHYCHGENGKSHLFCEMYDLVFGDCCVCNGYARLFTVLCDKAGIECVNVSGSEHEWNRVTIDGTQYFVDCTWDDGDEIKWKWCLKTRKEFYTELGHPKATKVCSYWKI